MTNWRKVIPGCITGNILELYDFIIYAYFSSIISQLFFPTHDGYAAIILTFGVFAGGNLMRPVGALFFGHLGDHLGRKPALVVSVGLMAISTTLIGLLPIYNQIGIYAPLLLALCRLLQGFSMCGEEVGAAIYLIENTPTKKHGLAGSIILGSIYLGLLLGSVIALTTTSLLTKNELISWGWRLPFLLSFFLGLIALKIRLKQLDSEKFLEAKRERHLLHNPVIIVIKNYISSLVLATLLCAMMAVAIYLFAVYIPAYFTLKSGFTLQTSMLICSASFLLIAIFIVTIGHWADKVGYKLPMLLSCFGFMLFAYPIFALLAQHTIASSLLAEFIMIILLGLNAGSLMPMLVHLFPVPLRFAGTCIVFNMSMTIFGGTAPIIAMYLIKTSNSPSAPFIYIIAIAITSALAAIFLNDPFTKKSTPQFFYSKKGELI